MQQWLRLRLLVWHRAMVIGRPSQEAAQLASRVADQQPGTGTGQAIRNAVAADLWLEWGHSLVLGVGGSGWRQEPA